MLSDSDDLSSDEGESTGVGLCEYLATNNANHEWINPVLNNKMKILCSNLKPNSDELWKIVGKDVANCITESNNDNTQTKASFTFDFQNFAVCPEKYQLTHYGAHSGEVLRTWLLEGSCDGKKWQTVHYHCNDRNLTKSKGSVFCWNVNCTKTYNMFRIVLKGVNSNKKWRLALGGFEIYGQIVQIQSALKKQNAIYNVYHHKSEEPRWETLCLANEFDFQKQESYNFSIWIRKEGKPMFRLKKQMMIGVIDSNLHQQKLYDDKSYGWMYSSYDGKIIDNNSRSKQYSGAFGRIGNIITCTIDSTSRTIKYHFREIRPTCMLMRMLRSTTTFQLRSKE